MKKITAIVAAATLTLVAAQAQGQDFNYDQFKPRTLAGAKADFLAEVMTPPPDVPDKIGDSYLDQSGRRWRVEADYTGRSRALEPDELMFVAAWLKSVSRSNMITAFTRSYLFAADGKEYWLPVEDPVAAFFPKELKPGDRMDLYLAEVGGAHGKGGWIWLPLVEEFRALENGG